MRFLQSPHVVSPKILNSAINVTLSQVRANRLHEIAIQGVQEQKLLAKIFEHLCTCMFVVYTRSRRRPTCHVDSPSAYCN